MNFKVKLFTSCFLAGLSILFLNYENPNKVLSDSDRVLHNSADRNITLDVATDSKLATLIELTPVPTEAPKQEVVVRSRVSIPTQEIIEFTRQEAAKYGWTGVYWDSLVFIIEHESHWNPNAQNTHSTAYGIYQFLDSTWGSYGCIKTSDYKEQTRCGLRRIKSRYITPLEAKKYWSEHRWY